MPDGSALRSLDILSAMFVPVVLISACAALTQTTAIRHQNVVTRLRSLGEDSAEMLRNIPTADKGQQARYQAFIKEHLSLLAGRAVMLQSVMTLLMTAIGCFVATSIAIGVVFILFEDPGSVWNGIPLCLGLLGALLVFAASVNLIRDGRIATRLTMTEIKFLHSELDLQLPKDDVDALANRIESAIRTGERSLLHRRSDE